MLKVGAATEVELKEKKHRIEDAVSTTKAAIEEGIVCGGGVTLLRAQDSVFAAADALDDVDESTGARIVARSLALPLTQIAINAGEEGGVVVDKVPRPRRLERLQRRHRRVHRPEGGRGRPMRPRSPVPGSRMRPPSPACS